MSGEQWHCRDDEGVDRCLEAVGEFDTIVKRAQELYDRTVARAKMAFDVTVTRHRGRRDYYAGEADYYMHRRCELDGRAYAMGKGPKPQTRLNTAHGHVQMRTRPAHVVWTNEDAALAWAREHRPEAVRVTPGAEALDKKALAKALLAAGEEAPGTTIVGEALEVHLYPAPMDVAFELPDEDALTPPPQSGLGDELVAELERGVKRGDTEDDAPF